MFTKTRLSIAVVGYAAIVAIASGESDDLKAQATAAYPSKCSASCRTENPLCADRCVKETCSSIVDTMFECKSGNPRCVEMCSVGCLGLSSIGGGGGGVGGVVPNCPDHCRSVCKRFCDDANSPPISDTAFDDADKPTLFKTKVLDSVLKMFMPTTC